jgi:hypothetical protein
MTITEFLLARIAEDEDDAQDAYYDGQRWVPEEEAVVAADRDLEPALFLDRKRDATHAANWSPARVLAECEAKRRIVADRPLPIGHFWDGQRAQHDNALRFLASVYADHPDYRDEWRV